MPINEKSCGIIPVKHKAGKPLYLLIQHNVGHWGFPKGHKDPGETDKQTALRELKEETGLEIGKLFKKAFVEKYLYRRSGKMFSKKVVYFVGMVKPGKVLIQEEEIKDYAWLAFKPAMKKLNFREMKEILSKASKIVSSNEVKKRKKIKAQKA